MFYFFVHSSWINNHRNIKFGHDTQYKIIHVILDYPGFGYELPINKKKSSDVSVFEEEKIWRILRKKSKWKTGKIKRSCNVAYRDFSINFVNVVKNFPRIKSRRH